MLKWLMDERSSGRDKGSPELLLDQLRLRLRRQELWDFLLTMVPLLAVFSYVGFHLHRSTGATEEILLFAFLGLIAAISVLGFLGYFPKTPKLPWTARLIDDKVNGKDRFVTLATLQGSSCAPSLLARLRKEAGGLAQRVDLKRDFPYRVKRSFAASLIASLALLLSFHLLLLLDFWSSAPFPGANEINLTVEKLSHVPDLTPLARSLQALVEKLKRENLSEAEKRALIQEALQKIEAQRGSERQTGNAGADQLLGQAANELRGMEKGLQKSTEQGAGGGIQSNLQDQDRGRDQKQSQGSGGEDQRDSRPSENGAPKGGQNAQGEKKESGAGQGDAAKSQERDNRIKDEKQQGKESETVKGEQEGKGAQYKYQEGEIPQGVTPAERFAKPGEPGENGIKGAKFVTVELPEAESGGSPGQAGSGKRKALQPTAPVSNVPLRQPDTPETAGEKQLMPLEYRDLIR